jgi:hypothetical protein
VKVAGNELLQCKGKQNEPPVQRYMPQVRAFIERLGFALKEPARMTGLVQDIGGKVHSLTALPDGLNVGGDLDLRDTNITALPDGLNVGGGLYLRGTKITALPDGLKSAASSTCATPTSRRRFPMGSTSAAVSTCATR